MRTADKRDLRGGLAAGVERCTGDNLCAIQDGNCTRGGCAVGTLNRNRQISLGAASGVLCGDGQSGRRGDARRTRHRREGTHCQRNA